MDFEWFPATGYMLRDKITLQTTAGTSVLSDYKFAYVVNASAWHQVPAFGFGICKAS